MHLVQKGTGHWVLGQLAEYIVGSSFDICFLFL